MNPQQQTPTPQTPQPTPPAQPVAPAPAPAAPVTPPPQPVAAPVAPSATPEQQPVAPAAAPQPQANTLSNSVQYTMGMLGKQTPGTLSFDGANIQLVNADGATVVFSSPISALENVKRAEYALYFKANGKTIPVMFGDKNAQLEYMAKGSLGLMGGLAGVGGAAAGTALNHEDNKASGLEAWVTLLQQYGKMGVNASPINNTVIGVVVGVVIVIVAIFVIAIS